MPQRYLHLQWLRLVRVLKKLARSRGSSHSIALGVALGFFIGMLPLMGIQMVIAAFMATIFRANRLAAILPVWVSNPATFIPLYGFNYWLGHKLTGWGASFSEYTRVLKETEKIMSESGFIDGVIDGTKNFASLGPAALASLCIGCVIVGVISAAISYPLTLRLVEAFRHHRAKRRAKRQSRVDDYLCTRASERGSSTPSAEPAEETDNTAGK